MRAPREGSVGFEATRVTRLVSRFVIVTAVLVFVVPPAGYLLTNLSYLNKEARTHASTSAELLSRLIYGHGAMWRFETLRLEEILTRTYTHGGDIYQKVTGLNGRTIIETGPAPLWPFATGEAAITESAWRVGTLEARIGLRPTLARTGLVALVSALAALATLLAARTLPLRMVRQAFRRLGESQAQLKLSQDALEQSHDRIVITDRDGAIQYANASRPGRSAGPCGPEHHLEQLLTSAGGVTFAEIREVALRGDIWIRRYSQGAGSPNAYDAEGICYPIRDERGEISHFIFVERDITEQLQLEARLRESQRLESLGTLAGGIAHDFNNILQPILGYVELLLQETTPRGTQRERLVTIKQAALRASELVGRILMFSRRAEPSRVPLQLERSAYEVAGLLQSTMSPDVSFDVHAAGGLPAVSADPGQMHQLLLNLLVNGCQAMPRGGTLTVSLEAVTVDQLACLHGRTLNGHYVHLTVADTGVGMDEETLTRIFEPFFTTKQQSKGTGLGLATVYGIVMNHQGGIQVTSRVGIGTRFEVYLPAMERPAEVDTPLEITAPQPGGTILVVDDEPAIAELLKNFLQQMGYQAESHADPRQAFQRFESSPDSYDLLITDKLMPELSGEDLIVAVRRIAPGLPVILCSGHADPALFDVVTGLSIDEFVPKPVSFDSLAGVVARVIAQRGKGGSGLPA